MYVLRDTNFDYLKLIDNKRIHTTSKLEEAIIFDEQLEAQKLLEFINIYMSSCYYDDFSISEIVFKDVE